MDIDKTNTRHSIMHKRHSLRKRALPGLLLLAGAALSYASPAGAATVAPGDGRGARTFSDGDPAFCLATGESGNAEIF